jgi:DNA-binding LacI/PurR family transcriptional regulator
VGRVTLQTVADKVGVSRMTVSNAFSRPDQLSATLRERILAAADELGYVGPDPAGRALARGSTGAVGIVLTDSVQTAFADDVATEFLGAIAGGLAPTGLSLTLLPAQETSGVVPARDVAMDGALVYHCDTQSEALQWLFRRKLPVVLVDQHPIDGVASVNVDDRDGARAAAQLLVDLGHRRIGIVTAGVTGPHGLVTEEDPGQVHAYPAEMRMRGWRDALEPAGIEPVVVRLRHGVYDEAYSGLAMLLDADPELTAVLCFSDTIAEGVLVAAADRGISVPADLSVVGFDDSALATRVRPSLTSVHQDVTEKGRRAAALLTDAVAAVREDGSSPSEQVMLPTTLVIRDSTAPPRSGQRSA